MHTKKRVASLERVEVTPHLKIVLEPSPTFEAVTTNENCASTRYNEQALNADGSSSAYF